MGAALEGAAEGGHLELVQKVLTEDCCPPSRYYRAVKASASKGHLSVVLELVRKKRAYLTMALAEASATNQLEIVKALLKEFLGDDRMYSVRAAAACGHLDVLLELLKNCPAEMYEEAAQVAKKNGHLQLAETLLDIKSKRDLSKKS